MRILTGLFIISALFATLPALAQTEAGSQTLRVATRVVPPLVIKGENDKLTGFSIELWDTVAERLKTRSAYVVEPDVKSLLAAVKEGRADLGVAAISITAERAETFDFSLPMLDAGLQIIVRGSPDGTVNPLMGLLRILFSPVLLVWLGIAAVLVVIPAHLMWWLERRHSEGIIPSRDYIPGIYHALWWAGSTLATQAEQMPRHWLARVLAVIWMFVGVIFVAYYTAQLTASLTVQEIRGNISGPNDLPGKRVATTRGSTAASYLRQHKAKISEFSAIEDAFAALTQGDVEAVVFDAPVLQFYAAHEGLGHVRTVGPVFRNEDYGIAFALGSPLRRKVDSAILGMREDGTYQALHAKWFGEGK